MPNSKIFTVLTVVALLLCGTANAQQARKSKYNGLLWEITGNGLKKPSYLFGTMHVSSKMAFHLSDSFFNAIRRVDVVALELEPQLWQAQMDRLDRLKLNFNNFTQSSPANYINENSFRWPAYTAALKAALSTEPAVINSLLYRSYKSTEDFEEDTFLDLYIYQTGKKLGKRTTGVEDYYQTEKIIIEAYADMAKEKKRRNTDLGDESMYQVTEKMQEAYRLGNLDILDSLNDLIEPSLAFREKFMYLRNEIQAASMDSIMKKQSLFTGVGAAHLPGPRGVIELLRQKGYHLRPVKMLHRDAAAKEAVDKLKVPVPFNTYTASDGLYKADLPGPLYSPGGNFDNPGTLQYADMANGCYYLVTRVKTHAALIGHNKNIILKKTDSLLYENIPGKILKKSPLFKNGYNGLDIINRTRRGDLQRYQIFILPFEVIIFKMSGKENYINGPEGNRFFNSIRLKEFAQQPQLYSPPQGGFTIHFPQAPATAYINNSTDGINGWQYEAADDTNDEAYSVIKKTLHNYGFLDADTVELMLMEESFRSPEYFERQLSRQYSQVDGYPCLNVIEKLKDSSIVQAKFIIKGPHYFVLAAHGKKETMRFKAFFNSFRFTPLRYGSNTIYTDSFMHFTVQSPVLPLLDEQYRYVLEQSYRENDKRYWPQPRHAFFYSDSTGEAVHISIQQYPAYFSISDSAGLWEKEITGQYNASDLVLHSKKIYQPDTGIAACYFVLRDTGSSKCINRLLILKDDYLYSLVHTGDTLSPQSPFISSVYNSFAPYLQQPGRNIFVNNNDSFFAHFSSSDSATNDRAKKAISGIRFREHDIPALLLAINRLQPGNKDYVETKAALIAELGYITDTTRPQVATALQQLYRQTADTAIFQNEIVRALARHGSTAATVAFKQILLTDPPAFDDNYECRQLFTPFEDSLALGTILYPDLLQLTSIEEYKEPVLSLLARLVDSGYIHAGQYEQWLTKILPDAKLLLKKQLLKDERKTQLANRSDEDDYTTGYTLPYRFPATSPLYEYAVLLAPFYDKDSTVPAFFNRLLQSRDAGVQLNTAITLLKNKRPVPDSIFLSLAVNDNTRSRLLATLEKIKRTDKFPATYNTPLLLARSILLAQKEYDKIDSVEFAGTTPVVLNNKQGIVYFFRYRVKKDDSWKMGISGLQPADSTKAGSNSELAEMTEKKLNPDVPEKKQFAEHLKKMLITAHNSGRYFFDSYRPPYRYNEE
jgi:uncharacterized protein YbaP (TraB family)